MNHSNPSIITLFAVLLLSSLSAGHASESSDQSKQIEERRSDYLRWIVENFSKLEPTMEARDGRRWALNYARLVLNRDVAKANGYFESFMPPPRDNDIYLIRFLRTLLDFRDKDRTVNGTFASFASVRRKPHRLVPPLRRAKELRS